MAAALLLLSVGHAMAACTWDSESGKYYYYSPHAWFTSPAPGATLAAPATFTIGIGASDANPAADITGINRIRLSVNGVSVADTTTFPGSVQPNVGLSVPMSALGPGVYQLVATVYGGCNRGAQATMTLTVAALPPSPPPPLANGTAGTIPGTASVQGGKATYSIPISLPPGVAGMVPAVSLSYGGGSANGVAGVGWALNASSSIGLCGPTIVQDGRVDSVWLISADRLCFDGKRLIAAQADYWAAAAEYRTEIFDGSRILRNGSGFKVYTKDGRIHYYGDTPETTREGIRSTGAPPVTHTWVLRRSEDRLGNAIDYSYAKDATTGEHLLTAIRWGANATAGQAAFGKVAFAYEARPDADVMFIAGGRADVNQRLSSITGWTDTAADGTGGTQALQYKLAYETSPTSGRSMVNNIQMCAASGECLPATTFAWGKPNPNAPRTFASKGVWNGPVLENTGHAAAESYFVGDFDGDGLNDMILRYPSTTTPITMYRNTGSSFAASVPGFDASYLVVEAVDFDGDGQTDLLMAQGTYDAGGFLQPFSAIGDSNLTNWQVCYSRLRQGQGFQCVPWAQAGQGPTALHLAYDFNGDGRQDIYFSNDSNDDGLPLTGRMCLSNGTAFTCTTMAKPFQLGGTDPEAYRRPWKGAGTTDLNGSGRVDTISFTYSVYDREYRIYRYTNGGGMRSRSYAEDGAHGGVYFDYGTPAGWPTQGGGIMGDINGDGYSDVALAFWPTQNASIEWRRCLSTGLQALYCEPVTFPDPSMGPDSVADFDGDGNSEVLSALTNQDTQRSSCAIRSGGSLTCNTVWTFAAASTSAGTQKLSIDFSGNGVPDRVYYTVGGHWEILSPSPLAYTGEALDRLVQVVDGVNKAVRFDYATPGDSTVYSPDVLDPNNQPISVSYPLRRTPRMGALVRGMKISNGHGAWIETQLASFTHIKPPCPRAATTSPRR